MSYGLLDDQMWCNPKLVGLTAEAFRLYVNAISYARGNAKDGRLTGNQQRMIARLHGDRWRMAAQCLVDAGLWEAQDGAIIIHDFSAYELKSSTDRVKKFRDKKRGETLHPVSGNGTGTGETPPTPTPTPTPVSLVGVNPDESLLLPVDLVPVTSNGRKRISKRDMARFIFEVWRRGAGKTDHTEFSAGRERLITQWIGVYPPRDLIDAAIGWRFSKFHRGENEDHRPYNKVELIFRNAGTVEQFRDFTRGANEPVTGVDEWLAEARAEAMTIDVEPKEETP